MKNILIGVLIAVLLFLSFSYFKQKKDNNTILSENSMLIQEQIRNVGKLVVTEGHFSEVFNYKNSRALFTEYFTAEKKALIVVNAAITISYDLSKIEYNIDKKTKTLRIISIPKEEISIYPELEYYDIQADFFNPFQAKDYNRIQKNVKASLVKKLEKSSLQKNAKNRLLDELSKFYILTHSLGWTLVYKEIPIKDKKELFELEL